MPVTCKRPLGFWENFFFSDEDETSWQLPMNLEAGRDRPGKPAESNTHLLFARLSGDASPCLHLVHGPVSRSFGDRERSMNLWGQTSCLLVRAASCRS